MGADRARARARGQNRPATPTDPGPAVKAFETAIAVARRQGVRSFGLRAALRLARLHMASGDQAQVAKRLKPALKGFAPSPEFPEIAEAQAHPSIDDLEIVELKRRKLLVKDEIARLQLDTSVH